MYSIQFKFQNNCFICSKIKEHIWWFFLNQSLDLISYIVSWLAKHYIRLKLIKLLFQRKILKYFNFCFIFYAVIFLSHHINYLWIMNKKKILSFRMPRLAKALKPAEIFQKIGKFAWYKWNNCNATYKSPDYDFSCTKWKSDFVEELNEEQAKEAQQKKNSEAIELSRNAIPQPRLPSSPFDTGFPAGFLLGPGIEQSFVRGGNSRQHQIGSNQRRQNDRNIRSRVVQDQNGEFRQVQLLLFKT